MFLCHVAQGTNSVHQAGSGLPAHLISLDDDAKFVSLRSVHENLSAMSITSKGGGCDHHNILEVIKTRAGIGVLYKYIQI